MITREKVKELRQLAEKRTNISPAYLLDFIDELLDHNESLTKSIAELRRENPDWLRGFDAGRQSMRK